MERFADIRLDRNLTVKRLPEHMQGATELRLVVYEVEKEFGAKSVRDIFEGTTKQVIKHFNGERDWFLIDGNIECLIEAGPFRRF